MTSRGAGRTGKPQRRGTGRALVVSHGSALVADCLQVALEQAEIAATVVCDGDELVLDGVDNVIVCDALAAERVTRLVDAGARREVGVVALDGASMRNADVDLPATATVDDLVQALRHGDRIDGSGDHLLLPPDPWAGSPDVAARLTTRERQVVTLLMSGGTSGQMAKMLGVSPNTIRTHVQNVMTKLGVGSRLEVASVAAGHEHGLPSIVTDAPDQRVGGPLRVLVAERRPLYATILGAGIEDSDDLMVDGTVHTTHHALELSATRKPDIVVVDAGLPPLGGVRTCLYLKESFSPPAVMIVDDCPREAVLLPAIEADADGYTSRGVGLSGFVMALRAIGRGEVSVPRAMQAALIRGLRERQREREWLQQLYGRLTRREREVLELLADGLSTDAAAEVLSISPETVRTHIQNALAKLGLHSRLEAAAFVRRHRSRRLVA